MDEAKNVQGIVLRTADVRDSSRMVDLFTLERGRLSLMARGAKRDKSRFVNLSAPYVEGTFDLIAGRSTWYLRDGQIRDAHLGLRSSIARLSAVRFAAEALQGVLMDGPEPDLFGLFSAALSAFEEAPRERLPFGIAAFLMKLMSFSGFRPTLGSCVFCGAPVDPDSVYWDGAGGGVRCETHGIGYRPLTKAEYRAFVAFLQLPLHDIIYTYDFQEADGLRMAQLSFRYYSEHTGRRMLRSLAFMQRLHLM